MTPTTDPAATAPVLTDVSRNDVALRGVLAGPPELRELPSGDTLLVLKLTVRRQPPTTRPPRPREPRQDTLTCVSYAEALITRSTSWQPGDVLDVEGALRRRVWRTPTGTAVAHEVECWTVRTVCVPDGRVPDGRDSAGRDSAGRDSAGRDSAGRDSVADPA